VFIIRLRRFEVIVAALPCTGQDTMPSLLRSFSEEMFSKLRMDLPAFLAEKTLNVLPQARLHQLSVKISSILIGGIAITLEVGSTGIGVRVSKLHLQTESKKIIAAPCKCN